MPVIAKASIKNLTMKNDFIMELILCIPLIIFGFWLVKKAIKEYKLKSYYDFQLLGAGIASIIIGIYFLYNVASSTIKTF